MTTSLYFPLPCVSQPLSEPPPPELYSCVFVLIIAGLQCAWLIMPDDNKGKREKGRKGGREEKRNNQISFI